ncbi:5-hydroxytryptamine receptor 3A isoform X2 [Heptranchias perlo]|uniref:5-hydroxytryptamine receptor 3A isoform X2 n=1 Tax=Heptranchias perlo TaxID=212740 RepID=UPI00355A81F3
MNFCSFWETVALLFTTLLLSEGQKSGNRTASPKPTLLQLSDYLMTNYSKGVRPVQDWRKTTTVAIDVMVYAILNVFWTDEFLTWNPRDFDDIKQISIPTANIWMPDILINEFVDVGKSPDIPYVYVDHGGQVKNYKPIQVVTACSLDIYNFPFDVQNCTLTFTSWLHNIRDINISLWRSPEVVKYDRSVFMNQGEWELLYVETQFNEFNLERGVSDGYAEMRFFLVIRRRPLFYAVSLLLPSIFLMVMDIIGFYLPPDSGERVSFKITLLLGYSVFLIIVSDTLPATAIGTPLIGVYFVVCMALLVISLTETILIVRLVHKQDLQPHVPEWVKHLVLDKATVLLCVRDKKRFHPMRHHSDASDLQRDRKSSTAVQLNHFTCENGTDCEKTADTSLPQADSLRAVDNVLHEVSAIRQLLEKCDEHRDIAKEWLQVGYVLDVLLFRVYLVAVLAYGISLGTLWSIWQYS